MKVLVSQYSEGDPVCFSAQIGASDWYIDVDRMPTACDRASVEALAEPTDGIDEDGRPFRRIQVRAALAYLQEYAAECRSAVWLDAPRAECCRCGCLNRGGIVRIGPGVWDTVDGRFAIEHHVRRADSVGGLARDEHTWIAIDWEAYPVPDCYQSATRRAALLAITERYEKRGDRVTAPFASRSGRCLLCGHVSPPPGHCPNDHPGARAGDHKAEVPE